MAKKRSIRGIAGRYQNYEIWRYPLGTMKASLRNPYKYKNMVGNILRFINLKTDEQDEFFIPSFNTQDVLDVFNDPTKNDIDVFNECKKCYKAELVNWDKQLFAVTDKEA